MKNLAGSREYRHRVTSVSYLPPGHRRLTAARITRDNGGIFGRGAVKRLVGPTGFDLDPIATGPR